MNIRLGAPGHIYRVFISSSNDASDVRRRLRGLIDDVFNPALMQGGWPFVLHADMWERTAAKKVAGKNVNEQFVDRALESNLTIVALIDHLRGGTKQELEAVLAKGEVELSVLRLSAKPREKAAKDSVGKYLTSIQDKIFYYSLTDQGPDSEDAWFEIVRQLLSLVLTAAILPEAYVERR